MFTVYMLDEKAVTGSLSGRIFIALSARWGLIDSSTRSGSWEIGGRILALQRVLETASGTEGELSEEEVL